MFIARFIPKVFSLTSRCRRKTTKNTQFWAPRFRGGTHKFKALIFKSGSLLNMWPSLVEFLAVNSEDGDWIIERTWPKYNGFHAYARAATIGAVEECQTTLLYSALNNTTVYVLTRTVNMQTLVDDDFDRVTWLGMGFQELEQIWAIDLSLLLESINLPLHLYDSELRLLEFCGLLKRQLSAKNRGACCM